MWPWEHAAVGYICASLAWRWIARRPPGDAPVLVLLFGTQFPDIVDKPLAWGVVILPSGQSLAHSLLFALPTVLVAGVVGVASGRRNLPVSFAVGYLTHVAGDILYPVATGDPLALGFVFYPLTEPAPYPSGAFFGRVADLFTEFVSFLGTPTGTAYLVAELGLVGVALALWTADGTPLLDALGRRLRGVLGR
jgi:hypothetical protein